MKRNVISSFLLTGFSLALTALPIACGAPVNEPPPGQNVPAHKDLFSCGIPLSCEPVCVHLGFEDCNVGTGALACAGNFWATSMTGTLQWNDRPGPGNWQGDNLMFFLSDGRVLVQQRTRECPNLEVGCDFEKLTWKLQEHQLCDVAMPPNTCQPGACSDFPRTENCMPVETDWTCDQVKTAQTPPM